MANLTLLQKGFIMGNNETWQKTAEEVTGERQFSDVRDMKFRDNNKHNIRILPPKNEKAPPFISYVIHWIPQANSIKGKPIIHARGEKCPVDEYISDLWTEINRLKEEQDLADNHPKVKAIHDKIQAVRGSEKFDFNILDRDDLLHEIGGKKKMACKRMTTPSTVWKPIFELAKNPKWGNPSDEEKGYDLEVSTEGEKERRKYTVIGDRDTSPLTEEELECLRSTGYDLSKMRSFTSSKDVYDALQNAKPPFDEIINYLREDKTKKQTTREEPKEEQKKEERKEEPKKEEPEQKKEQPKEEQKKEEPKEEPKKETEAEDSNDPNDLNSYECKGEFDSKEELCNDCPVKADCVTFQPTYRKAVEWNKEHSDDKIDLMKTSSQIESNVKSKFPEAEAAAPKLGKRKRDIPF